MSLYYVKVSLNLRVDAALAPIYAHCGNAARCLLTSFFRSLFAKHCLTQSVVGGIVQVINKYFYVLSIYCLYITETALHTSSHNTIHTHRKQSD